MNEYKVQFTDMYLNHTLKQPICIMRDLPMGMVVDFVDFIILMYVCVYSHSNFFIFLVKCHVFWWSLHFAEQTQLNFGHPVYRLSDSYSKSIWICLSGHLHELSRKCIICSFINPYTHQRSLMISPFLLPCFPKFLSHTWTKILVKRDWTLLEKTFDWDPTIMVKMWSIKTKNDFRIWFLASCA